MAKNPRFDSDAATRQGMQRKKEKREKKARQSKVPGWVTEGSTSSNPASPAPAANTSTTEMAPVVTAANTPTTTESRPMPDANSNRQGSRDRNDYERPTGTFTRCKVVHVNEEKKFLLMFPEGADEADKSKRIFASIGRGRDVVMGRTEPQFAKWDRCPTPQENDLVVALVVEGEKGLMASVFAPADDWDHTSTQPEFRCMERKYYRGSTVPANPGRELVKTRDLRWLNRTYPRSDFRREDRLFATDPHQGYELRREWEKREANSETWVSCDDPRELDPANAKTTAPAAKPQTSEVKGSNGNGASVVSHTPKEAATKPVETPAASPVSMVEPLRLAN
jgi:hypothetical protein